MIFTLPHAPLLFDIPDDWLRQVGALQPRAPAGTSYAFHSEDARLVALADVEPPRRSPGFTIDAGTGFSRERLVSVMVGMIERVDLPPVKVARIREADLIPHVYPLRPTEGFHRYYASVALGFTHLPVLITR